MHKKKFRLENVHPNYLLKLWSKIAFKMNLDCKRKRPFSRITFKMDLDQKRDFPLVYRPSKQIQIKKRDDPLMESPSKWIQTVCKTLLNLFSNGRATISFLTFVYLKGISEDYLSHCQSLGIFSLNQRSTASLKTPNIIE